jgi:hypothetical protein
MADNSTIIYATPSLSPSTNNSTGQYATAAIWSKAKFLSQIDDGTAAGTDVVCLTNTACRARIQNFDDRNRQTRSYGDSSVVIVPAQELIPTMVSCWEDCRVSGPHAEVYVTVVWAHTAIAQRVILFETALIKSGVRVRRLFAARHDIRLACNLRDRRNCRRVVAGSLHRLVL